MDEYASFLHVAHSMLATQDTGPFPAATTAPTTTRERIGIIDTLRGFALLGILLLNIDDFAGPETSAYHDIPLGLSHPAFTGWHTALDYIIVAIKWSFFEGKMRALFAMLFGAGIVLLLQRLEARVGGARAADIFHRRNMWLAAFGLIHGLFLWSGDILTIYATCALLIFYPLRNVSPRKLLIAGLSLWLIGGTVGMTRFLDSPARIAQAHAVTQARANQTSGKELSQTEKDLIAADEQAMHPPAERMTQSIEEGRRGFVASIPSTREGFLGFDSEVWTSGWILEVTGAIMTGMGLFGVGFFSGKLSPRTYFKIAAAGYCIAIPLSLAGVWYAASDGFSVARTLEALFGPYMLVQVCTALANASTLILVTLSGRLGTVTKALAAVGRMAVTNYLLTTVLCRFVFSWGPWKLYGSLEFYQYLYVVFIVWTINVVLSRIWLRYFAFGPVEWAWRSLTYWELQPMKLPGPMRASPVVQAGR